MTNVTLLFRNALRAATGTIAGIAEEAGYSREMFDEYANRRSPSRAATLALADALDARATRLVNYADKLRAAAHEAGGASGDV